jgi:integrase/recombinase XerD
MTTIKEAFEEFIISKTADGLATPTIKWYASLLAGFIEKFGRVDLVDVTRSEMRSYIVSLSQRTTRYEDAPQKPEQDGGLSIASIEGHKRALSAFWSWADSEYILDENPMRGIKRKRRIEAHPKAISMETFKALCHVAKNQSRELADRDLAILFLLADTGMRATGLIQLKSNELDLVSQKVIVLEKGLKRRAIPFTQATRDALIRWMLARPETADHIFCGFRQGHEGEPITVSGLNQILKRLAKKAHIKETVSPHRLRHMFAREYLNKGGDLATLSRLLGHEDMNITKNFYAVFTDEETAQKHQRFSPISDDLLNS